ncbi:N-acetylglucosamine-6-phosphate deacetylase [Verrucomicrobium sp. BvORR034]|uniref:N-acetylglucosamine-6-phosphate deacetylase n=1 Tax=Verrucomicrobium sp. BvORR034 TaxID=1396418 RepID=UPI000679A10A|nr:N-acetylglucosamine-6-phosphate deacetylase [Verrucomicrobium sp. BvORR034]
MFDLQVNGYAGTDFNRDGLTAEALHHACECLKADGVSGILATIITDELPAMENRLATLARLREADPLAQEIIAGFHIEGPFINPEKGYVGAHPPHAVKPATVDNARRLLDASQGLAKLVTLAPEHDAGFATTAWLTLQGVCVSAGHCNPTYEILRESTNHGLKMFTHVGNGCPMLMHRHDNIVQRALSLRDRLWLCFIPDGVHIEFFALQNYLRAAGVEHSIFVTDAISASRLGPGKFTLAGWDIVIGEDLVARSPDGSHFVGSTVTWPRIQENNTNHLGLSEEDLHTLSVVNPRKALGL